MNLHPREAVLEALDVNHRGFAVVHHYLDVAVQETVAQWEHRVPDLRKLHGAAVASSVRGLLMAQNSGGELRGTTLRMHTVNNCGQHLYDRDGQRYRILERPLSQVSPGRLLPVSEPEIDTLFGPAPPVTGYELAVLWTINYQAKSLGKAVLAAVADFGTTKAAIYAEEILPDPIAMTLAVIPPPGEGPAVSDDDIDDAPPGFGEYFDDGEEGVGDEPS